jgi:hypothetical protein
MTFLDLQNTQLADYIENAFSKKDQLIVYQHVPKCAGTSSVEHLKTIRQDHWHFPFDKIEEYWENFAVAARDTNNFKLVAGHFEYYHVDRLINFEVPFHGVTFVRHPIDRLVSDYRYNCTPKSPLFEDFIRKFPTFESYAMEKIRPNAIAHTLVGGAQSFEEYLEKLEERFTFIGLQEFYHLSMTILLRALGAQYIPTARKNVTQDTQENDFEIAHSTYEKLAWRHFLDMQLYEYLQQSFIKLSEAYIALISNESNPK